MANFEAAFDYMMSHEDSQRSGAVAREPKGAIAKYGINSLANPGVDVASLTLEQAKAIYQRKYWAPVLERISSQRVASKVFDAVVNEGFVQAVRLLQRAINRYSLPRLAEDGQFGPETLTRVNAGPEAVLLEAYASTMESFYRDLVARHPEDTEWLQGWVTRAWAMPKAEKANVVAIA